MSGQIRRLLDHIVEQRAHGNEVIVMTTKTKLMLKGVDPEQYNASSADDPAIIQRVKEIAKELGVSL
jgi:hypothetical protein